jgi:hypothetical protein
MEMVHGLWIGPIGHLEELTLRSFSVYAHFNLWTYDSVNIGSIENVSVKDGEEIIPREEIFLYPDKMDLPFGGGTHVGFSEIFRYKVLYEKGGWWSDMDVTCLKPLSLIKTDYFFREHGGLPLAGNIMKCPPRSELMRMCYEESKKAVNEKTTDWHLSMKILCQNVKRLGLSQYINTNMCNLDRLAEINKFKEPNFRIPESWHFVHWMNTIFEKNVFHPDSAFADLLRIHRCSFPRRISFL